MTEGNRVLFLYWGRRGLNQFVYQLAEAASELRGFEWQLSVSRQNGEFTRFREFGPAIKPIDTFTSPAAGLSGLWRVRALRRDMSRHVREAGIDVVINLMPHIWSPFVASAFQRAGARYLTIVHDAQRHPGDLFGLAHSVMLQDAYRADTVMTLSEAVTRQLRARRAAAPRQITTLFHPRLIFGPPAPASAPSDGAPFRLLFWGRIRAYKGLHVLVGALERLRECANAPPLSLSVMGQGDLGNLAPRLKRLDAKIDNHWLSNAEIATALTRHHGVVLAHVEASQSGVAAASLGARVPVIAMPVGGITEQIADGITGVIANGHDEDALATAILRLACNPRLHADLIHAISASEPDQSMTAFVKRLRNT